ncbi:Phosphoribosylformylglycinamidine synthase subunit PurL [uncultured archaeon]|nr:Phosphoribosylformylglycinamidine synthase subunit PurL [uncultured archaeon]
MKASGKKKKVSKSNIQISHDDLKVLGIGNAELLALSKKMLLSLDLNEMLCVQEYYKKLGREPKQIELETIAQTWSEHCKHKTFSAEIEYTETDAMGNKLKRAIINSLFKTFIREPSLKAGEAKKDFLVSVFSDNAGIIRFNENYNIAMKAETHNHPSALDPFGGANTGLGGVIRDVLGAGLGAKPFANTDVFCFARPDYPKEQVPKGILHPKRIFKGVRAGVADYGNKIGIPTVNGAILFDDRYLGNPLVYCGTVGVIPRGMENKNAKKGDLIVVIGGRTGRDGIHGATFSSIELDTETSSSAVQIGNPIEEKKMLDAILKARDLGLYTAITDCGAGGFSSAVGEMASELGARVDLEKAPLKYKGLTPWEIWLSEAQERMILAVPKKNFKKIREICEIEGTEATIIGEFTCTKKLELCYNNALVGELDMEFMHNGVPTKKMEAEFVNAEENEINASQPQNLNIALKNVLAMPNIASKEKTVRGYDHEVQGGSVGKPFVGIENDGPSDAAVVRPLLDDWKGVVVSNGINPFYSDIDPYWMACSAIDEAIRNAVCVGVDFETIALLDNFSWANPEKKKVLGQLARACMGCADSVAGLGTPFISGKDSLYNEYNTGKETIAIPGTLLISAIGIIPDSRRKISMDLKKEGNSIYIIGETFPELGGSHYAKLLNSNNATPDLNSNNGKVPKVDFSKSKSIFQKLSGVLLAQSPENKIVVSCHDCSEGGFGVAISEMCFAGGKGAEIDLAKMPLGAEIERNDFALFSESNSRFITEVEEGNAVQFEKEMQGVAFAKIGNVTKNRKLSIRGLNSQKIIDEDIYALKDAWKGALWW